MPKATEFAWEVYSLGDIAYLQTVYRGLAMVFSSGNLALLGLIGFMVAVIMVGMTGIIKGGRELPAQNILVCFVVWWAFFGLPPQNVILIDKYTGRSDVVTNVPFGVAVSQSFITSLGMSATRMMEQAFANPGMTDTEFGSALHAIVELRQLSGFVGHPEIGRIQENASNYFGFCAPWLGNLGDADALRRAFRAESALDASLSVNPNITIPYRKRDDTGTILADSLNCADAYRGIKADLESDLFTQSVVEIGALGGREDVVNDLDAAYSTLSQQNLAAVEQMRNMVMAGPINKGLAIYARRTTDLSVAAMMEPAVWQRNVQWAAEGDLFMTFVRPLITFIEGFIVAVTPMMALMIAASLSGIMLVFSYLKMTIWVQLWFPLLAIINLFLTMAMARDLDSVAAVETIKPGSIEASWGLIQTASTHIATAGMLAAAVPALAYALISMSPMAFTHLMGRLQGSDTVNEKILAPDVMTPSTGVRVDPVKTSSEFGGTTLSGAGAEAGQYSIGYSNSHKLLEAQTHGYRATEGYLSSVGNIASRNSVFQQNWNRSVDKAFSSDSVRTEAANISKDDTDAFASGFTSLLTERFGLGEAVSSGVDVAADPVAMAAGLTKVGAAMAALDKLGQAGAKPTDRAVVAANNQLLEGLKAFPSVRASYQDVARFSADYMASKDSSLRRDLGNLVKEHESFGFLQSQGLAIAARDSDSTAGSTGISEADQRSLQQNSAELQESAVTWQSAHESGDSSQIGVTGGFDTLSRSAALRGSGYVNGLTQRAADLGLGASMNTAARYGRERLGMEGDQAAAYGALVALAGGNGVSVAPTQQEMGLVAQGRSAFAGIVQDLTGRQMNLGGASAMAPAHLGASIEPDAVRNEVVAGIHPENIPAPGAAHAAAVGMQGRSVDDLEVMVGGYANLHQAREAGAQVMMAAKRVEYGDTLDTAQDTAARGQYDVLAENAQKMPGPTIMQRVGHGLSSITQGSETAWNDLIAGTGQSHFPKLDPDGTEVNLGTLGTQRVALRSIEDNKDNIIQHIGHLSGRAGDTTRDLAVGLAVGDYINTWHSDQYPTMAAKLEAAEEFMADQGITGLAWERQKPMVIMGLLGHKNPTSSAVERMADQIHTVDSSWSVHNKR